MNFFITHTSSFILSVMMIMGAACGGGCWLWFVGCWLNYLITNNAQLITSPPPAAVNAVAQKVTQQDHAGNPE